MDLIHNQLIRIIGENDAGFYRVILDAPDLEKTALVRLDPPTEDQNSRGGRRKKAHTKPPRKKPPAPLVCKVLWFDRSSLLELKQSSLLLEINLEPESTLLTYSSKETARGKRYKTRIKLMETFLDLDKLSEGIRADNGIGGLVKETVEKHQASRSLVYKCFSLLCRYGFSELSLHPRYDRCGAPGVQRPCEPGGRKKAGAKTTKQRIAREHGENLEPDQPGMSADWRARILAADQTIQKPKPSMGNRTTQILSLAFVASVEIDSKGKFVEQPLVKGTYPNRDQIRYVLEKDIPKLERVRNVTTNGHFDRSKRGIHGHAWEGMSGPGHTWAIDSTVGDLYLRSSINRAWIIGRPIVYVLVDVWSTAITGFYVCLTGPSWAMAKISLFNASIDPELLGRLWGYESLISLNPIPTLCHTLLCDRGEYLSKGASTTGSKLDLDLDYTPPYRPDLKGLVEVLHRIAKDQQFRFVPGAIDYRRKEYELRRYQPEKAALTLPEYVRILHIIFDTYNLTANREHRLDAHMHAANVSPTPAGLWRWGHQVGIGYRRVTPFSELVTTLLPSLSASVRRDGVFLDRKQYDSPIVREQQWSTLARNYGHEKIPVNYYPGSVSRIWTPQGVEHGIHELTLVDQSTASPELTWDEVADAKAYHLLNESDREHTANIDRLKSLQMQQSIIDQALAATAEADLAYTGAKPSVTEARSMDTNSNDFSTSTPDTSSVSQQSPDLDADYLSIMQNLLELESEVA